MCPFVAKRWRWEEVKTMSWVRIPAPYTEWTFFTYICCKNYRDVCLKRPKINEKRPGLALFLIGNENFPHKIWSAVIGLKFCLKCYSSRYIYLEYSFQTFLIRMEKPIWLHLTYITEYCYTVYVTVYFYDWFKLSGPPKRVTLVASWWSVWPEKNRQMSIKLAQNWFY